MSALFFADKISTYHTITGEDADHISRSLRMKPGEMITIATSDGFFNECEIIEITSDLVKVKVKDVNKNAAEPNIKVTLFQALIKSDKMDTVIQKAVELGVYEIVPIITDRCISRPDEKTLAKKTARWQKISKNAAMQSRRGIIPCVKPLMTLYEAAQYAQSLDKAIVYYEKGGEKTGSLIDKNTYSLGVFVGSEGGFDDKEVEYLNEKSIKCATLGNRILRTETAPLAALCIIMHITDNM